MGGAIDKRSSVIVNCSVCLHESPSSLLVGQNEWPMNHLLHGPGRWWMQCCLVRGDHATCHSSDPLFSLGCDNPRVQTIAMTIYIRFLAYWFAVVFCLIILGDILKNEYYNPNSNSNSNSTGSDACCTETALAEATLNTSSYHV